MDKINGAALADEQLDDILRERWSYQGVPSTEDIRLAMRDAIAAHVSQHNAAAESDALTVLEFIAADADAGTIMLTSGIRLAIDAALIKAGRKKAPEPVRHFTIAGLDR
jgi:beta-glucosidase-like glycosyl hydrolase